METAKALRSPYICLPFGEDKRSAIKQIVDPLLLSDADMGRLMSTLLREMECGLSRDPQQRQLTSLQMENTYVRSLLDGKENGDFLALDLGGTNFRVLLCRMRDGHCQSTSRNYNVPNKKLYGPASEVFDHLAESIYLFLKEENVLSEKLPLGFTFSFPMVQEGLKCGILVTWTKSFACPDGVGEDAVKMLEDAIARRGDIQVDVVAVLNDTTGTLLAGSYLDKHCGIGLIMGTGCNAAYVEKVANVDKWTGPKDGSPAVVVDIEWGAFGDNGSLDFIRTPYEKEVDLHSNHVGSFTFEKSFAGHYIGDLARLIMLRLADEQLLFGGSKSDALLQWGAFTAQHLSDVECDTDADQSNTWRALRDLDLDSVSSSDDVAILRYLCCVLSIRAAQIVAASISVLLNRMQWPENAVAIDGSLYRYHPNLHAMMTAWIAELAPSTKCRLLLAEDGSGRGAAFVAAVATKQWQQ